MAKKKSEDPNWCVLRDEDDVAIEAGYHVTTTVEADQYHDPDKDVIKELMDARKAKRAAEWDHDLSGETDVVKFLYEFLKKRNGV